MVQERERELLQILWREGRLSRWELHERSGQTPNGVGNVVANLIRKGILRECPAGPSTGGRPRVPVEIDPDARHVLGVFLAPDHVELCRLNLSGQRTGDSLERHVPRPEELIPAAVELLPEMLNDETLSVGIAVTGLVNLKERTLLWNSTLRGDRHLSLQPLFDAVDAHPLLLTNDIQALGVRWMLTHRAPLRQDVLLVGFADGQLGASLILDGHPNRGSLLGANELGHNCLPVEAPRCYCGKVGCLERIFSTGFLHQHGIRSVETLETAISATELSPAVLKMIHLLAMGISNSANLVRPHQLVLASGLMTHRDFVRTLEGEIRSMLLPDISRRLRIDAWELPELASAETAAWAALADLYANGWEPLPAPNPSPAEKELVGAQ
ncbi:MAG: ROK family transcriptional regulator [Phycisphaerae bacterium]